MIHTEIIKKLQNLSADSIEILRKNYAGLKTRASSELVAPILVNSYGQKMPINQLASITTPDAKTINLQVYDKELTKEVAKQISLALDLNPKYTEQQIIINLPQLTEDRRAQYVKRAKQYSEEIKIAIRAHRRNAINDLNKLKNTLPQDDLKKYIKNVEEHIYMYIAKIDKILKEKTQEIMSI